MQALRRLTVYIARNRDARAFILLPEPRFGTLLHTSRLAVETTVYNVALGLLAPLFFVILLGGCAGSGLGDALKLAEGKAYDAAAEAISLYCEQLAEADPTFRPILWQEKRELRREVCQRGHHGPAAPPDNPGNCAGGPVVVVWCEGTEVPATIWPLLEREWQPGEP